MMMNTLSDLASDRLILGLGAGGRTFRAMVADDMATWPPLRAMRQTVQDFRKLLAGDRVTWGDAAVSLSGSDDCFSLGALPVEQVNVPVYMGAVGPRMTELTGEIADGILIEIHTRVDQMPEKLSQITRGAQRAGRELKDVDVASIIVTSVSRDGMIDDITLCWVAQFVARLDDAEVITLGFDPELVTQIKSRYQRRSFHAASKLVTPEMISAFAATGTAMECQWMIERYVAAGANLPILVPFGGDLQQLIEMGKAYIHS
jgi:5,10-methylenetetrahydromethanopterin reductase